MRRALIFLWSALIAALLSSGREVQADEALAADRFAEGSALFQRGDFKSAARSFQAAYVAEPHPAPLYNGGLAWLGAGRLDHAADLFALALRMDGLDAGQRADATLRLEESKRLLVQLDLRGLPEEASVQLDDGPDLPTEGPRYASQGTHTLTIRIDGEVQLTRSLSIGALKPRVLVVELALPSRTWSPRLTIGVSLLGGALAFGAVAVATGIAGLSARDAVAEDLDAGAIDTETYEARDRAAELRVASNVFWVLAGVSLVTGGVLIVVDLTDEVAVVASPTQAALRISF